MAMNGRTYSDAQNRAMDAAMRNMSPSEACRRAAAGRLTDPDGGKLLPAFSYNVQTANVRKRRNRRQEESRIRAELPALAQLSRAAETLAGVAHEQAAKIARKHRAGRLTPAELADAARALRETHRAVLPLLAPTPANGDTSSAPAAPAEPSNGDAEVDAWARDAARA